MSALQKLQQKMKSANIDAVLITSFVSRFYLSKFKSSMGYALVLQDRAYFFVDFRYIEAAKKEISGFEVILADKKMHVLIQSFLTLHNIKTLAFENLEISYDQYEIFKKELIDTDLIPLGDTISKLREIKSDFEISIIKQAQRINEQALLHTMKSIKEGISELDIALELEWKIRKLGCSVAFDFIVLSGKNTSRPHGVPTNNKIKLGDFITIDFGAKYLGYCSDMTRTFSFGNPTDEMKKVYQTVKIAKETAQKYIKSGVTGCEIDKYARDIIDSCGYRGKFGHSLGHGVGIEIHESPSFAPFYDNPIIEKSVLSVEPGIYLENQFGVRIEDLVCVTKNGYENFNNLNCDLIIL